MEPDLCKHLQFVRTSSLPVYKPIKSHCRIFVRIVELYMHAHRNMSLSICHFHFTHHTQLSAEIVNTVVITLVLTILNRTRRPFSHCVTSYQKPCRHWWAGSNEISMTNSSKRQVSLIGVLLKIIQFSAFASPRSYHFYHGHDVVGLYSHIPHEDGLKACHTLLERRTVKEPPTSDVVHLARLVLELNSFQYQDKFYLQTHGTAMGTRMAPSYANLFMACQWRRQCWTLPPGSWCQAFTNNSSMTSLVSGVMVKMQFLQVDLRTVARRNRSSEITFKSISLVSD